jgi:iron complex outermembrane receptor protein
MIFNHTIKSTLGNLLLASVIGFPVMAIAQDENEAGKALEEVIVTAQKRAESLQEATISITALQGEEISKFAVMNPNDLQNQLPAVQFMTSGLTNTMIRGVGTYNNQPNVDAAVAWNIDGTYISHHHATPPILFDLARMEVVRGPLGTLYGRNSNGGAINILTARPELGEWRARASVGVGNYNALDTEFMLNMPIGESSALRLSFANDYADGYFDDGGEGTDNYAFRARYLYEPNDRLSVLATFEWSEVDGSGVGLAYCPPTAREQRPLCADVEWKPYQGFGLPGNYLLYGTDGPIGENPGFTQRENTGAYVEVNYNWDFATLTSITNWHDYNREELHVWDFNSYNPYHTNTYITQEFRLTNAPESSFDWVVGLYYGSEDSDGVERFGFQVAPDYDFFQIRNSYGVVGGEVTTIALFGEVTVPITDTFRLKGGLRYTDEEKDLPGFSAINQDTPNPIFTPTGGKVSQEEPTWLVGAEWDLTEKNMVYAKVNTGFKSATVNQVPPGIGVPEFTDPEEITAYQIGSKNRFMDDRVQVNAEFFYYDYEGYQVVVIATDPTGVIPGSFFPSFNAQKAEFIGGEIETSWLIGDNGQLDLNLTLLDAEHKEFVTSAFDYSGNDVQRAPPFTIQAGYRHDWDFSDGSVLTGRITTMYVEENYSRDANLPGDWQESYTNTSAYLSYVPSNSRWSVTGWVRNLEDDEVIALSRSTDRGGWSVFMFPPRTYGITLKYEM